MSFPQGPTPTHRARKASGPFASVSSVSELRALCDSCLSLTKRALPALVLALTLLPLIASTPASAATPPTTPTPLATPASLQNFLRTHCIDCHDADIKKGGLDLTSLPFPSSDSSTPNAAAHKQWVRVFDRVTAGEMPPADEPRPAATDLRPFLAALGPELSAQHAAHRGTVLRRLNRREYQNTLNDLLGLDLDILARLPEDGRAHGFDTVGEALNISGTQLQRYLEVAEFALNAALLVGARPPAFAGEFTLAGGRNEQFIAPHSPSRALTYTGEFTTPGSLKSDPNRPPPPNRKHWLQRPDGAIVVFNNGGFPSTQIPGFRAAAPGTYRVRVTGYGYKTKDPAVFSVIAGTFNRGADQDIRGFLELPLDAPGTAELTLTLRTGDGLKLSPVGLNGPDGHSPIRDGPDKYPGEGLAIQRVAVEGPLLPDWPPRGQKLLLGNVTLREVPPSNPRAKQRPDYKPTYTATSANPAADARTALRQFLPATFRRPVTDADLAPYAALFDREFAESQDYLIALRTAAVAALCAPDFLYLKEPAGRLDDHALAARLSYFLTRSAPDTELLALAASKKLSDPATLRAQTERLLSGPGFDRFITDFTNGWLNLREIDFTTPDKLLYPEFDELLLDSMLRETRAFARELFTANLGLGNVIASDFAMLNHRLARHYGLPPVEGLALRKTPLAPDSRRGGLLTQASILKVSANGTNTSPVIRGVWVLDRILGLPPQPPPPGVPGVEPDIRGATTLREILEKHRSTESCNSCHRSIDPPGFALESYDVIGGWRDRFRSLGTGEQVRLRVEGRNVRYRLGPPVDAAGQLATGEKFSDFPAFQKLLLAREDDVARCVAEKLLTFATGRELGFSDRPELTRLVAASKSRGHPTRDLLHALIQSPLFLSK